jgi:hypothetical protein
MGLFPIWLTIVLPGIGGYFIANAICQKIWKEESLFKRITFAGIFLISYAFLIVSLTMVSMIAFRR